MVSFRTIIKLIILVIFLQPSIASRSLNQNHSKLEDSSLPIVPDRKLWGVCEDGQQAVIHYFEVVVQIQLALNVSNHCTLADQMKMGFDINSLLSSHVS
jgi:hypothetical protein